jgi:SAM-dependent methyltransferase
MTENVDWRVRARRGFLASGIDPADKRGHKNYYIDLLQKMALEEVLELKGDEFVLDFGSGGGRMAYWIAPRVKKVVGLEITPEMIDLAERNRTAENVEFILYDKTHFPAFQNQFDLIVCVWVLQYMEERTLKRTVSTLAEYLRNEGRFYVIEQVSDNPKMVRPKLKKYLKGFEESRLECLQYYPIRKGRWWLLYFIRYGFIPLKWFPKIAAWELEEGRRFENGISYYRDFLFFLKKA